MLEVIAESQAFVEGTTLEELGKNPKTFKALAFNLLILGEAARHVPLEVEIAYDSIPWNQIRGMRNHIAHGYDQIDLEIVWRVVTIELPLLTPLLERLLEEIAE